MTCYHSPPPPGQVQPFGPVGGELFEVVLLWGWEVGQIKNNFSLILRRTCHFSHSLNEAVELKATYLKVCFKISTGHPSLWVWNENLLSHKRMGVTFWNVAKSQAPANLPPTEKDLITSSNCSREQRHGVILKMQLSKKLAWLIKKPVELFLGYIPGITGNRSDVVWENKILMSIKAKYSLI